MRNLIIHRRDARFNRRKAMAVYIEDPQGDENIHGNPCRLLGTVGSGEIVAFPVSRTAARIYVLPQDPDQDTACEFCCLPEGDMDLYLSGHCQFSPFAGHPFHFDAGSKSLAVSQRRKALLVILLAAVTAVVLGVTAGHLMAGLSAKQRNQTPQVFQYADMQITLTADFRQVDVEDQGFTVGYASSDTSVFVIREAFADEAGLENFSVEDYAQLIIDGNAALSGSSPTQEQGLTLFEYTAVSPVDGESYTYLVCFFKGTDAFWMIEFSTEEDQAEALRQTYLEYAASVCFAGNFI